MDPCKGLVHLARCLVGESLSDSGLRLGDPWHYEAWDPGVSGGVECQEQREWLWGQMPESPEVSKGLQELELGKRTEGRELAGLRPGQGR